MIPAAEIDLTRARAEEQRFIVKVYGWMSLGLAITALVAVVTASYPALLKLIVANRWVFYGLLIAQLILVGALAGWVSKMSAGVASFIFVAYAALNGLTFSIIFLVFTVASIATTFIITAGTFGLMSAYGYFTKRDLTSIGNLCFMALLGLIVASIVNLFWTNSTFYWITTYAGVLIFVGLTAYDTQKIKQMNVLGNEGTDEDRKEAIVGALALYLDFINLFLLLLRIFGRRR